MRAVLRPAAYEMRAVEEGASVLILPGDPVVVVVVGAVDVDVVVAVAVAAPAFDCDNGRLARLASMLKTSWTILYGAVS